VGDLSRAPAEERVVARHSPGIGYDHTPACQVRRGHTGSGRGCRTQRAKGDITFGDIAAATPRPWTASLSMRWYPTVRLQESLEARAEQVARDQVLRVRHSMALEDQQTSNQHLEGEVAELRRKLLAGKRSRLWQ